MIKKNIIANILTRAWGILSVYLFIPLYLKFLGIEAYGLVGFYTTLLGVLTFADMGFTATLNREMARLSVLPDGRRRMQDLLRTYETAYFVISSTAAGLIVAFAPLIASRWLHSKLPPETITATLRMMGCAVGLQLFAGLFAGGLMGLQQQVRINLLQVAWGILRAVGAVLLLWLVSPSIIVFAAWQLFCNGLYCLAARFSLWRSITDGDARPRFQFKVFRETWRYATGMALMAVVSTILTQMDKLAVSKMLPLETLGYYTLAGALASVTITLAGPINLAVFPRLTALAATGDHPSLSDIYHLACELIGSVSIPAALTLGFFAGEFLTAWTGRPEAATAAGVAAVFLVGGHGLQTVTITPYCLALAKGNIRITLWTGIISVVLIAPLLLVLIPRYGIAGAGLSWLVMNVLTLPPYMYLLHRDFLPGEVRRWALVDVGRPLAVALPCVLLCRWAAPETGSRWLTFILIGAVWGMAASASILASPRLRTIMWRTVTQPGSIRGLLAPDRPSHGGPQE